MFARLRQNLYRYVVGNEILLDQRAHKVIFRLACGGETDFDLFKSDLRQKAEKIQLSLEVHRFDKRLISVAEVDAAPYGRTVDRVLFRPLETGFGGQQVLLTIFFRIHGGHLFSSILFHSSNKHCKTYIFCLFYHINAKKASILLLFPLVYSILSMNLHFQRIRRTVPKTPPRNRPQETLPFQPRRA